MEPNHQSIARLRCAGKCAILAERINNVKYTKSPASLAQSIVDPQITDVRKTGRFLLEDLWTT